GFLVAPGNPKNIRSVDDLVKPGVRFINRQGGSGTRVLLDFLLSEKSIEPSGISGYLNEEFTHMNVAAAVFSGAADAGLAVMSAARALNLDFVPVATEQYDLLVPEIYFDSEKVQLLLAVIRSPQFIARATTLGGYHFEKTGTVDKIEYA
ncbi:MAG: substrate-binding domain-containing protein, partial [Thermodesulfobacteriota bacterium]